MCVGYTEEEDINQWALILIWERKGREMVISSRMWRMGVNTGNIWCVDDWCSRNMCNAFKNIPKLWEMESLVVFVFKHN